MRNKDLIKVLQQHDPESWVVLGAYNGPHTTLDKVQSDEGINDYDGWSLLSDWRDLKEMEDFYGATDSDPLAFVSLIVLS